MSRAEGKTRGPQFVAYFGPILEALRELGGSGKPQEIIERIAGKFKVSEAQQQEKTRTGVPRFANKVHWARQYLVWSGHLDSSQRGVWSLTESGWKENFTQEQAVQLFRETHKARLKRPAPDSAETVAVQEEEIASGAESYKRDVLDVLKNYRRKALNILLNACFVNSDSSAWR